MVRLGKIYITWTNCTNIKPLVFSHGVPVVFMSCTTIRESTLSQLNQGAGTQQFSLCELRLLLKRSNLPLCRYPLVIIILKLQKRELSEQCLFYLLFVVPGTSSKPTVVIPLMKLICHSGERRSLKRHKLRRIQTKRRFNIYSKRAAFNVCTSQAHGQCQLTTQLFNSIFCQVSSILSVV